MALKKFTGQQVKLVSVKAPEDYSANCRLMGPIKGADGSTVPQFFEKAFNDELKFAGLYADDGKALTASLDKIQFSSISGLTSGWWEFGLTLTSNTGKNLSVESRTEFKSGFDAITACNQTAQALGSAVQDLINKTVSNPQFAALLK